MLAGTELAHALAYSLVYPQARIRWRVMAASGHGYTGWLTLAVAIAGALSLVGVFHGTVDAARRRPPRPVPAWAFGLLPLVAFSLQEFLERWVAVGGFPWWTVEQPTFAVGLALQLPFALLGFVLARLLSRVVEHIGVVLRVRARIRFSLAGTGIFRPTSVVELLRPPVLADRHAGRGPPRLAAAPLLRHP